MQVEYFHYAQTHLDFLTLQLVLHQGGSNGKASVYIAGDPASIPGSGRSPGEGNGNIVQYSCLGNLTVRGAYQATVHGWGRGRGCSQSQT